MKNLLILFACMLTLASCTVTTQLIEIEEPNELNIGETFGEVADYVVEQSVKFSDRLLTGDLTSEALFNNIVSKIKPELKVAAQSLYVDWKRHNSEHVYDLEFTEYLLTIEQNGKMQIHNCARKGLMKIINTVSKETRRTFVYVDKKEIALAKDSEEKFVDNIVNGSMEQLKGSMNAIVLIQQAKMVDESITNPCERISGDIQFDVIPAAEAKQVVPRIPPSINNGGSSPLVESTSISSPVRDIPPSTKDEGISPSRAAKVVAETKQTLAEQSRDKSEIEKLIDAGNLNGALELAYESGDECIIKDTIDTMLNVVAKRKTRKSLQKRLDEATFYCAESKL